MATLATLAAAVPAGLAAERWGALRVSLAAGALIAVSAAVQATAAGFGPFLAGGSCSASASRRSGRPA